MTIAVVARVWMLEKIAGDAALSAWTSALHAAGSNAEPAHVEGPGGSDAFAGVVRMSVAYLIAETR